MKCLKVYHHISSDSLCNIFVKQNGQNKQGWSVLEVLQSTKNVPLLELWMENITYIFPSRQFINKDSSQDISSILKTQTFTADTDLMRKH